MRGERLQQDRFPYAQRERRRHEADEVLDVHTLRWAEVRAMIRDGVIVDAKTLVALLFVETMRPGA